MQQPGQGTVWKQLRNTITGLMNQLNRSGFAVEKELWPQRLTAEHLPALTEALARIEKPLEEQYFAARQASADLAKEQEACGPS